MKQPPPKYHNLSRLLQNPSPSFFLSLSLVLSWSHTTYLKKDLTALGWIQDMRRGPRLKSSLWAKITPFLYPSWYCRTVCAFRYPRWVYLWYWFLAFGVSKVCETGVWFTSSAIVESKESKPSTVKEGGTQVPTSQKQSVSWLTGTW